MSLHPVIAGKLARGKGRFSLSLHTRNSQQPAGSHHDQGPVKRSHTGQDNVKQRVFCIPWGQKYNPGGNKTQADHVGPVNVICKVLITTWHLCEAVCAGSQLRRQRRPDLLLKQHDASHGDSLGNEIFSLLGILFEWAALNKLRASQMLCLYDPLSPLGCWGRGGAQPEILCCLLSFMWRRKGLCVYHTQCLTDDTQCKCF